MNTSSHSWRRLHRQPELAPAPDGVDFIQSDSRAVYHALGGPIPQELQPYARQIDRQLELVGRLSPQEFPRELERTRLEIRKLLLRREQEEISALARDSGMDVAWKAVGTCERDRRDRPAASPRAGKCRHQVTTDTDTGVANDQEPAQVNSAKPTQPRSTRRGSPDPKQLPSRRSKLPRSSNRPRLCLPVQTPVMAMKTTYACTCARLAPSTF